jgi:hypothetical protein
MLDNEFALGHAGNIDSSCDPPPMPDEDLLPENLTLRLEVPDLCLYGSYRDVVQSHAGDIVVVNGPADPIRVGTLAFDILDIEAMREYGYRAQNALRGHDRSALGEALFLPESAELRPEVLEGVASPRSLAVMYVRDISIDRASGKLFARYALYTLVRRYGRGCGLLVLAQGLVEGMADGEDGGEGIQLLGGLCRHLGDSGLVWLNLAHGLPTLEVFLA